MPNALKRVPFITLTNIVRKFRRKYYGILVYLMLCFPLWSDKFTIVYTAECQRCDILSALSAGHSVAMHGVQTGGTLAPSNMFLCPRVSDKLKSAEKLDCCYSQHCQSHMTLSGQKGR
jgi:hypothetical protein